MRLPCSLAMVLIGAALCLASAPAQAETIRDAARRFSFEVPAGWQSMEADEIATINAEARQRIGDGAPIYERGFRPAGSMPLSYPYVLLQVQGASFTGASYDDIERDLAKGSAGEVAKVEEVTRETLQNLKVGQMVLDRSKNRILMRTQMDAQNVGTIQGLTVGHLGAKGNVYFHAYAREGDLEQRLADLNALNDSFRFDPGAGFAPGLSTWGKIVNGSLFGALAGGAIGGLVALFSWWKRRQQA